MTCEEENTGHHVIYDFGIEGWGYTTHKREGHT